MPATNACSSRTGFSIWFVISVEFLGEVEDDGQRPHLGRLARGVDPPLRTDAFIGGESLRRVSRGAGWALRPQ